MATLVSLLRRAPPRSRLDELCEFAPADGAQEERVYWLVRMATWLRPGAGGPGFPAKLRFLRAQLTQHPEWRARVGAALSTLLRHSDAERAMAHAGIPRHFHFGGAVREWLHSRALPAACRTGDLSEIIRLAFAEDDARWVGAPELVALARELVDPELAASLERALRTALIDLAHQIVAQAHAPAVRAQAQGERSPYTGLYEAVAALDARPDDAATFDALAGRLRQCARGLHAHRATLADRGADLNTTFVLARLRLQLHRLHQLAALRHGRDADAALGALLASLVGEVARHDYGRQLWTRSADLVVQNLVDSAATVGRAYLDADRSSWRAAFLAGVGGGALMALATVAKCLLAALHLPTLYEGLVNSLNYAAAFCAAYLLHFTIATKLPAHTAAALARAVQAPGGHRARLREVAAVWRTTVRLQLAGLVGNVVVAGPLAFAIDVVASRALHRHVVTAAKAAHLLHDNSIVGPSVLYAALTGVFLWASSLIGAAADNWTRTTRLGDRLATNPWVMKRLGAARARPYADAIVTRAGGLLGNLSLGFLLGGVPAAFAIASLPVQIRHITVSTGSVALALAAGAGTRGTIALALVGLAAIAAVNVAVSFALALWLALRATRGMRASRASTALVRVALRDWVRRNPRARAATPPPTTAPSSAATLLAPTLADSAAPRCSAAP